METKTKVVCAECEGPVAKDKLGQDYCVTAKGKCGLTNLFGMDGEMKTKTVEV